MKPLAVRKLSHLKWRANNVHTEKSAEGKQTHFYDNDGTNRLGKKQGNFGRSDVEKTSRDFLNHSG